MRPHKFTLILSGRLSRTASAFRNGIKPKKQLKRACLDFFGDISGENLNKTVIAQTSFPCYETKIYQESCLMKLYKVDTSLQMISFQELFTRKDLLLMSCSCSAHFYLTNDNFPRYSQKQPSGRVL